MSDAPQRLRFSFSPLLVVVISMLSLLSCGGGGSNSGGSNSQNPTQETATPTFSVAAGTYNSDQSVTIDCATPGANIYYTTDGSTPTSASTKYTSAVAVSLTTTLKAFATASGHTDSAVASATYTLKVSTPAITPAAGTYASPQTVTIRTATPGASIHYTTDGSTPTPSSTVYAAEITVSSNATVKAIATKTGYSNSDVASNTYTIGGGLPSYTWKTVKIIGGGFVTGINFHPTQPNLVYARTDVGGAYRWDNTNQIWMPLTDWIGYDDSAELGIEAIGLDPSDPQRLYLAGGIYSKDWQGNPIYGKMLVSTDQGSTFQVVSTSIPMGGNEDGRASGNRFAVDPNYGQKLYYGSKNTGLWTSNDHGLKWSKVTNFPVTGVTNGNGIVFVEFVKGSGSSGNPTPVIYAGVADTTGTYSRLYRSTDSGSTWTAVPNQPSGLASLFPNHGVFGPDGSLYMSFADAIGPSGASTGAVWKYTPTSGDPNGAGTWTNITPPHLSYDWYGQQHVPAWGSVAVDPQRPGVVMASTLDLYWQHDGFARSTDGGQTWIDLGATAVRDNSLAPYTGAGAPGNWINLAIDPFNSDHVLYGWGGGIWASNDVTASEPGTPNGANQALQGGTTHWAIGANGLEEGCTLKLISPSSGPHLVSGMGDFVGFVHTDLTQSPAVAPPQWANTSGLDFAERAPSVIVRVVDRGTAPWGTYTTDGGTTWTGFSTMPTGSVGGTIAVSADGATFVWSAQVTDSNSNVTGGKVAYSTDRGATWITSTGAPVTKPVYSDRVNPKKFYIMDVSATTLYRSTDGGVSFTAVNTALPTSSWYWPTLMVSYGAEGDLWLVSDTGLYHSTDSGSSFTKVPSVQAAYGIGFGMAAPGASYPAIYLSGKVNDKPAIYRSVDEGLTWVRINDDQHQYGGPTAIIGDPRIFGRVYFGAAGRGIIYGDSPY